MLTGCLSCGSSAERVALGVSGLTYYHCWLCGAVSCGVEQPERLSISASTVSSHDTSAFATARLSLARSVATRSTAASAASLRAVSNAA